MKEQMSRGVGADINGKDTDPWVTLSVRKPLAVTIAQFRSLIPLSRTTVYEKINDGSLRTMLVGRRRLILWSSVEALMRDSEIRLR